MSRQIDPRFRWLLATVELCWAIELTVMFDRWCRARDLHPEPHDMRFFKLHWVKMCMRLGDHNAHRIIQSDATPRLIGDNDV